MKHVEMIQVIRTTLATTGNGKSEGDPIRRLTQYWSLEGELLAEIDEWENAQRRNNPVAATTP